MPEIKVVYGDTDSVYITSSKTDRYDVVTEGMNIKDYINIQLNKMNNEIAGRNYVFIELEKVLEKVLFTDAKKRYAYTLLWDDNKKFNVEKGIKIQGFDAKRSDSNEISKIIQKMVIEMMIKGSSREDVVEYLRSMDKKMRTGEFTDEQIGFPKGIAQEMESYDPPTPVIKGATFSNQRFQTTFGKGSKPKFIYIKTYNGKKEKVTLTFWKKDRTTETISKIQKDYPLESIAFQVKMPPGFAVDWDKMSEATFDKKVDKLFQAVGWPWEELRTKGLMSFM